jgi:transcriptional regulator with XRE-family HTH domain
MNEVKAGRILRLVRRRRRLTQTQLAALAGISQQTVSSIELGHADDTALRTIRRLAAPLGITVELDLKWRGPEFDRLDDARHAAIVRAVVARFGPEWEIVVEYTFNHFGDRGSVDVLAWHAARSALLLIEIKSELDSLEAVLRSMDVKVRVVPPLVAAQQGWRLSALGSVLVLPDESSSRRCGCRDGRRVQRGPSSSHSGRSEVARGTGRCPTRHLVSGDYSRQGCHPQSGKPWAGPQAP